MKSTNQIQEILVKDAEKYDITLDIIDYFHMLTNHNWNFPLNPYDAALTYKILVNKLKLEIISKASVKFSKLYEGVSRHHYFNTEKTPMPLEPKKNTNKITVSVPVSLGGYVKLKYKIPKEESRISGPKHFSVWEKINTERENQAFLIRGGMDLSSDPSSWEVLSVVKGRYEDVLFACYFLSFAVSPSTYNNVSIENTYYFKNARDLDIQLGV